MKTVINGVCSDNNQHFESICDVTLHQYCKGYIFIKNLQNGMFRKINL